MTTIKGTTAKGNSMIARARWNEGFYLDDVYERCSRAKHEAWRWCFDKMTEENGRNFHIVSHNSFGFTVAWEVENGIRIETKDNSYLVLFPEFCNK